MVDTASSAFSHGGHRESLIVLPGSGSQHAPVCSARWVRVMQIRASMEGARDGASACAYSKLLSNRTSVNVIGGVPVSG